MKKIVLTIIMIVLIISIMGSVTEVNSEVIIPNEAIRLRIIPNSNTPEDQLIKGKVKEEVQKEIATLLKDVDSIDQARILLDKHLPNFNIVVEKTLKENNAPLDFKVKYGQNFFPEKTYKGITYPEGEYESVVVELGKAEGDNWWCVLFPPLCVLEAEESETEEVEYKSFIKEIIDKYF